MLRKVILVFCVSLFLTMAFSGSSPASLAPGQIDVEDLLFEGDFLFDLDGAYFVYGIGFPLNVLGSLEVFSKEEEEEKEKLGNLSVTGQKNLPLGEWDGTYFGHWAFDPTEGDSGYEIGIFSDLSQFGGNMLGFTLEGFNEALGIPDEIPRIVGSLDGENFEGSPVPIPASVLLFGSGLIGFIGLKRRRQ